MQLKETLPTRLIITTEGNMSNERELLIEKNELFMEISCYQDFHLHLKDVGNYFLLQYLTEVHFPSSPSR